MGLQICRRVLSAADSIADSICKYIVVVTKSTVPVGTGKLVRERIAERLAGRDCTNEFDVVSTPSSSVRVLLYMTLCTRTGWLWVMSQTGLKI